MALKTKHFFPFIKMVRALNLKDSFKEILALQKSKGADGFDDISQEEGIDIAFMFIENLPNAEKEALDFLTLYTEKTRQELGEQKIEETIEDIKRLLKEDQILDFFRSAMKSTQ